MNFPIHFTRDLPEVRGVVLPDGDLFSALATALQFPHYFGHNWDAVADCLSEIGEVMLVVRDASMRWKESPDEMRALIDVWLDAASDRSDLQLVFVWS
jgi:RNAse (barnase) inhibitor barstar